MDIAPDSLVWHVALDSYRYSVNLRKFPTRDGFPGWFDRELEKGDRSETIQFENRFRKYAASHLEPWYEVVFWKMYSQGYGARFKDIGDDRANQKQTDFS